MTLTVALAALAAVLALAAVTWVVSVVREDASYADRIWGPFFVVTAWTSLAAADEVTTRGVLVAVLVTIWGVRLAAHVTRRSWGEGEDPRYTAMRERNRSTFARRSLVTVFALQAVMAWVVSAPLFAVAVADHPAGLTWVDAVAGVVWLAGFLTEAVADRQLARFRADPANADRVLDTGLWRYSRHPNYFGDAVMWWGFGIFALAVGAWPALLGPVVMTVLIVKVSGVALTERRMAVVSRRRGHADYVARTNAFVPGPPRRRR